jgi:hypothetical protein
VINLLTDLVNGLNAIVESLTVPRLLATMLALFIFGWYKEIFILGKTHKRAMDLMDRSLRINERTFGILKKVVERNGD